MTMDAGAFDRSRIKALLAHAVEWLEGDWLLVGGALAAVWFRPERRTEDIDLVDFTDGNSGRLRLLELAEREGIPVEALNSAADYFVRRVPDWKEQVEPWLRGSRATLWRPTPTLFLLLKVHRLSEADLQDCLLLVDHCAVEGLAVDTARVGDEIAGLPAADTSDLAGRRADLMERLEAFKG